MADDFVAIGSLGDIVTVEVHIDPATPPPSAETWVDHGDHVHRVIAGLRLGPARRPEAVEARWPLLRERPQPERWPGTAVLLVPPEDTCAS